LIQIIVACLTAFHYQKNTYKPGSGQNAVAYVKQALDLCKIKKHPVLVFSKERYDFFPQSCAEKKYYESNTVCKLKHE